MKSRRNNESSRFTPSSRAAPCFPVEGQSTLAALLEVLHQNGLSEALLMSSIPPGVSMKSMASPEGAKNPSR